MNRIAGRARKRTIHILFLSLLLPLCAQVAGADEVTMRDGSHLLGKVIKRENGTLDFETAFAGVIRIKWDQVAEVRTDKPMELLLTDDSIVTGTHLVNNVDDLIVETESGAQPQTLAQGRVAYVNPEPWRKGHGYKLSGRANLAFDHERGNTDKDELDFDGDLTWRRKHDRFRAFGELELDRNNNQTTTRNWKLEGAYHYFVTRQWFWGGFGRIEHDKFADLNLRTTVGPMIGYQWFESTKMNLSTSTGISYVKEDFISQSDNNYPGLAWAVNFDRFMFGDFMQFYHKQLGIWNLNDTGDLVWDTWTGLRFPLILGLVASTELKVEVDSGAAKGVKNVDTTYLLKLGYQW